MIISKLENESRIYTAWRKDGKRHSEIKDFKTYFYVLDSAKEFRTYSPSKYITREFIYEKGDYFDLNGNKLKKVIVESPSDIKTAKGLFTKTYESDVPYHFRYTVDNIQEMPEYNLRKWYWDMEWCQGGEYHDCITTIVVYDNYDKKFIQWVWFPDKLEYNLVDSPIDKDEKQIGRKRTFDNEKDMIQSFMTTMVVKDPDMLIAWFGQRFDLPHLIKRACALGLDPRGLSPIFSVKGVSKTKEGFKFAHAENGFSPIEQAIGGRITLSLDLAFERQWNDSQRGTLPSLSLEYVSQLLFQEGKVKESKFTDKNEFFRRAWLEDTEVYLEYALKDVELIVRIDEENFCSESIIALQRLLKAPFDACFYASHMGSIYFMRNAWWKAPAGDRNTERKEYDGAMIYDPLSENTQGLHLNVAGFDFASLYPSMIIARNISFETKSDTPTAFGCDLNTPRHIQNTSWTPKMKYFKTDSLGLLPKALLELKDLRNEYKKNMKTAETKEEYAKWYNNQMAVKRLSASFYGILAYQGFGWSDVDLAASITASAREAIRFVANKVKEMEI